MTKVGKKLVLATIISTFGLFVGQSQAATGVFGSYVAIDPDGPGGVGFTFYGAQQPGPNFLTAFNGLNLGSFYVGDIAQIAGGELLTFKNGGGDVTGAELQWRVNPGGSFAAVNLGFTANATFNDAAGNTFSTSGDQKWAQIASTPNFLSGLTPGSYTLEVFFRAFTNEGDRYSNNGGSNFIADFEVLAVPEPSTILLLAVGAGIVYRSRRRITQWVK